MASPLIETPPSAIEKIVETNVLGTLLCCRAAITQALDTNSGSRPMHVFLMDGAGSDGGPTPRVRQGERRFTRALHHRKPLDESPSRLDWHRCETQCVDVCVCVCV